MTNIHRKGTSYLTPPPMMIEHKHGDFVLRHNPVLVARVLEYRRVWG